MADNAAVPEARGYLYELGVNYGIFDYITSFTSNGADIDRLFRNGYLRAGVVLYDTDAALRSYEELCPEDMLSSEGKKKFFYDCVLEGISLAHGFYCHGRKDIMTAGPGLSDVSDTSVVYMQLGFHNCYYRHKTTMIKSIEADLFEQQMAAVGYDIRLTDGERDRFINEPGEFMSADTIVLLRKKKLRAKPGCCGYEYMLLVSDESVNSGDIMIHADTPEELYRQLEIRYGRQAMQSFFRSSVITGRSDYDGTDLDSVKDLITDRQIQKAVQAASYGCSLIDFLHEKGILDTDEKGRYKDLKTYTICGFTNIEEASINLSGPSQESVDMFRDTYRLRDKALEYDSRLSDQAEMLRKSVKRAGIRKIKTDDAWDMYGKTLHGRRLSDAGQGSADAGERYLITDTAVRQAHGKLVEQALGDPDVTGVYLLAAPGIGKTTSVVNYMKSAGRLVGTYIAPRTAIVQEMLKKTEDAFPDTSLSLSTNFKMGDDFLAYGNDLSVHTGQQAVGDDYHLVRPEDMDSGRYERLAAARDHYESMTDDRGTVSTERNDRSVIQRSCECSGAIVKAQEKDPSADCDVVLTAFSSQACAKVSASKRIKNLPLLFGLDRQNGNGGYSDESIKLFKERYGTALIMTDEITGDEGGMETAGDLDAVLRDMAAAGINTKFIAADASMQDENVVNSYSKDSGETIFISRPGDTETDPIGISYGRDRDYDRKYNRICKEKYGRKILPEERKKICYITCNTYPAESLDLVYNVARGIDDRQDTLGKIYDDVCSFMETRDTIKTAEGEDRKEQAIIYIQKKDDLREISQKLEEAGIRARCLYSDMDVKDKAVIQDEMNAPEAVDVLCMTSSGARGLSFKYVTHIFIEVPRFSLGQNLMEIMQTIYRGRGDEAVDTTVRKTLLFYFNVSKEFLIGRKDPKDIPSEEYDRITRRMKLNNRVDPYTMILLLEGCIETRIYGKDLTTGYAITPLGRQGESAKGEDILFKVSRSAARLERKYHNGPVKALCDLAMTEKGVEIKVDRLHEYEGIEGALNRRFMKERRAFIKDWDMPVFVTMNGFVIFGLDNGAFDIDQRHQDLTMFNRDGIGSYMKEADRLAGSEDRSDLEVIKNHIREVMDNFQRNFVLGDTSVGNGCLAFPVDGLGMRPSPEDWNSLRDNGEDIVALMREMFASVSDVSIWQPFNGRHPYKGVPWFLFFSGDFEKKMGERFVNTELMQSSSTNMLSIIFRGNVSDAVDKKA